MDDEPIIIEGLKKLVNWDELGVECCFEAYNGIQALDIIHRELPGIMICDVKMPEMDGIELLKRIRQEGRDLKVIILSGFDHFEYVKAAMKYGVENYLLKPVDKEEITSTLLNTIDKINNRLYEKIRQQESNNIMKENILNRLVSNRITANELEDKADFLGIHFKGELYTAVVFDSLGSSCCMTPEEHKWKAFGIFNIVSEIIGVEVAGQVFQLITGGTVAILSCPANEERPFERLLTTCIENINRCLKIDVLVCMGEPVRPLENIHISYSEASRLLHYRYTNKKNHVIYYGVERKAAQNTRMLLKTKIADIEDLIISCDEEQTFQLLERTMKELELNNRFKPLQVEDICTEMVFLVVNVIKRCKLNLEEVTGRNVGLTDILKFESLNDFFERIKELCSNTIRCLNNKKHTAVTIHEIVVFISENFQEDMSIKTLSARFNISPAYLGQLIRNETGETFSDYLNKLRIKKAKELILVTNKNVSEICSKVGYSDPNYFCKVFKKYTGMNPSQFKLK